MGVRTMNANVEKTYQACSVPIISKQITSENYDKIAHHLLKQILDLKNDVDIQNGDRYQIIIRKLDYSIVDYSRKVEVTS